MVSFIAGGALALSSMRREGRVARVEPEPLKEPSGHVAPVQPPKAEPSETAVPRATVLPQRTDVPTERVSRANSLPPLANELTARSPSSPRLTVLPQIATEQPQPSTAPSEPATMLSGALSRLRAFDAEVANNVKIPPRQAPGLNRMAPKLNSLLVVNRLRALEGVPRSKGSVASSTAYRLPPIESERESPRWSTTRSSSGPEDPPADPPAQQSNNEAAADADTQPHLGNESQGKRAKSKVDDHRAAIDHSPAACHVQNHHADYHNVHSKTDTHGVAIDHSPAACHVQNHHADYHNVHSKLDTGQHRKGSKGHSVSRESSRASDTGSKGHLVSRESSRTGHATEN